MRFSSSVFSILVLSFIVGTTSAQTKKSGQAGTSSVTQAAQDSHSHAEHGPHGGEILEVGKEEYHLELCVDETKKQVVIYLMDKTLKQYVAIDQSNLVINLKMNGKPAQFKLKAIPQDVDQSGSSSCYGLASADLLSALHDKKADARLALKIGSKQYSVKIQHDHDHAGHNHAQSGTAGKTNR